MSLERQNFISHKKRNVNDFFEFFYVIRDKLSNSLKYS